MSDPIVLATLADSPPYLVVAYLVFLVLTKPPRGVNRHSRRPPRTGADGQADEPRSETE